MLRYALMLLILSLHVACADSKEYQFRPIEHTFTEEQKTFIDSVQYKSFLFFIEERNNETGLVKDRNTDWAPSSIASTGFAIPIYAIGAERGWISREEAAKKVLTIINFLKNSKMDSSLTASGYKGFYYHFLDMESGERKWESELSSIDTALLLAGMIFARNYFSENNESEKAIREITTFLINRVEWDFLWMHEEGRFSETISLGWYPESGIHEYGWVGYNEALILYIIAAGSGASNMEVAYEKWTSFYDWRTDHTGEGFLSFPPMFGHQYSHFFIDFRGLQDDFMRSKNSDYFINSQKSVKIQQHYAIENPMKWTGYDSLTWGFTACDGPGPDFNSDGREYFWYIARGTSGIDLVHYDDGTIAPTAAGGSIVFAPELVASTLLNINEKHGEKLWCKYGFKDAFNATLDWYATDYIGIDQAAFVIMIENLRTGIVWKNIMNDPLIKKGLKKLNFKESQ